MGGGQPTIDCNVLAVNVATFIYSFYERKRNWGESVQLTGPKEECDIGDFWCGQNERFFLTY